MSAETVKKSIAHAAESKNGKKDAPKDGGKSGGKPEALAGLLPKNN